MERSRLVRRLRGAVPVLAGVAIVLAVSAPAPLGAHDPGSAFPPDALVQRNCREVFPIVEVPFDRADAVVPRQFEVFRNEYGNADVFMTVRRCAEVSVGRDVARDVVDAYITVSLVTPDPPPPHASFFQPLAEHDDASSDPGLSPLEGYLVEWTTTSALQARWLRQHADMGERVTLVPGLSYDYEPVPGPVPGAVDRDFDFVAPEPARSPFSVEATVTEPTSVVWDVGTNRWADTAVGTAIIFGEHPTGPDQLIGPADGFVTATDPATPLGFLFGAQARRPFRTDLTAFMSGGFGIGQWTKCVRTATNPCTPGEH
jgi:hypothetical protein